jgi:hypothetical protein
LAALLGACAPAGGGALSLGQSTRAGTNGLQGVQGIQGIQGFQGIQGVQGVQGFQGFQGLQGFQGFQGFQGIQGFQGMQGIQGMQGVQGLQGLQGVQGLQGLQGLQGFQGMQGLQGFQGMQGIQGMAGADALNAAFADAGDYIADQMLNALEARMPGFKAAVQPTVANFARANIAFVSDTTLQKVCEHPGMHQLCLDLFAYLDVMQSSPGFAGVLIWHTLNINALEVFLAQGWQLGMRGSELADFGLTLLHYYALAQWRVPDHYVSFTVPGKSAPVGGWFNNISLLPAYLGSDEAYARVRDALVTSLIEMTNVNGAEQNFQDAARTYDDCVADVEGQFPAIEAMYNCTMDGLGTYGIACIGMTTGTIDPQSVFASRLGGYASELFGRTITGYNFGEPQTFTDNCGNLRHDAHQPGYNTADAYVTFGDGPFAGQGALFYTEAWQRQRVSCSAWFIRTGYKHPACP